MCRHPRKRGCLFFGNPCFCGYGKYFCKNIEIQLDNWGKYVYNSLAWLTSPERILDVAGCHRREGKQMSEIRVKENESLESALRRFKRSCAKEGVIAEVKKREH